MQESSGEVIFTEDAGNSTADPEPGRLDTLRVTYGPVGIAMTRALGDSVMIRAGVIPTPIVETYRIFNKTSLVLATDGIWDVLSNRDVTNIIINNNKFSIN